MANFSKTELEASLKCLDFSIIEKFFSDMLDNVDVDDPKYDDMPFPEYLADIEAMNGPHATASLPQYIADLLMAAFLDHYSTEGSALVDEDGNLIAGV